MSNELEVLALYGFLTIATIMIQVLLAVPQVGLTYLASPRDEGLKLEGLAARMDRAAWNCIAGMALFAPAALAVGLSGASTAETVLAAQVFLIARVVYVIVYAIGIPWIRTLTWIAALLATIMLYAAVL